MGSVYFSATCCQKDNNLKFEINSPSARPINKSDINQKIRTTLHMESGLNEMNKHTSR